MNNLYALPAALPEELTQVLAEAPSIRIERIVSHGHATPEGHWYDQDQNEWVVVLKGQATLRFEGDDKPVEMNAGDFMTIEAHQRHRVESTKADVPTIWLAVFFSGD